MKFMLRYFILSSFNRKSVETRSVLLSVANLCKSHLEALRTNSPHKSCEQYCSWCCDCSCSVRRLLRYRAGTRGSRPASSKNKQQTLKSSKSLLQLIEFTSFTIFVSFVFSALVSARRLADRATARGQWANRRLWAAVSTVIRDC